MTSTLSIDKININGGTQSRAGLNALVVEEYAATIRDGGDFPPLTVFYDGKKYWLADGFHRLAAYQAAGAMEVPVAVHQGDKREAILFSVGANAQHGLQRTDDDKRRAVTVLLSDKEWSQWSDRQIAKQCGVSHPYVAKVRGGVTGNVTSEKRVYQTKHGTTATMDTANIGKVQTPETTEQKAGERIRQDMRDALPDAVKEHIARKGAARVATIPVAADDDAATAAELDEMREANAALTADVERLTAEVSKFEGMRVQFEQGGFEKVVAGKDEEIRILKTQVETESRDKVKWKQSADYWKGEALKLGWTDPDVIPLKRGGN